MSCSLSSAISFLLQDMFIAEFRRAINTPSVSTTKLIMRPGKRNAYIFAQWVSDKCKAQSNESGDMKQCFIESSNKPCTSQTRATTEPDISICDNLYDFYEGKYNSMTLNKSNDNNKLTLNGHLSSGSYSVR